MRVDTDIQVPYTITFIEKFILHDKQRGRSYTLGKWDFGLTMMIVGMGGTLLTLWILSFLMVLLKKIFPISTHT